MKPDIATVFSASMALSFLCACLYLIGFWGVFGINPFEFITLQELTLRAIYPLAVGIPAALLYALTAHKTMRESDDQVENGKSLRRRKFRYRFVMGGMAIVGTVWMIANPFAAFFIGPVVIGLLLALYCLQITQVRKLVANATLRNTVVFLVVLTPVVSLGFGLQKAQFILAGISYSYIEGKKLGDAPDHIKGQARLPFLGKIGDYGFFLLQESKDVWVVRLDMVRSFELVRAKNRLTAAQLLLGEWAGPAR